ncbi:MAG: hypothetical protein E6K08_04640 [Methanobacteriota archaeon]|nr:MAG: hypothetical protein E6K08_04640 [Euryarchaeota archaeon]
MGLSGRTMKRVATLFNNEEYERLTKVELERVELERNGVGTPPISGEACSRDLVPREPSH